MTLVFFRGFLEYARLITYIQNVTERHLRLKMHARFPVEEDTASGFSWGKADWLNDRWVLLWIYINYPSSDFFPYLGPLQLLHTLNVCFVHLSFSHSHRSPYQTRRKNMCIFCTNALYTSSLRDFFLVFPLLVSAGEWCSLRTLTISLYILLNKQQIFSTHFGSHVVVSFFTVMYLEFTLNSHERHSSEKLKVHAQPTTSTHTFIHRPPWHAFNPEKKRFVPLDQCVNVLKEKIVK